MPFGLSQLPGERMRGNKTQRMRASLRPHSDYSPSCALESYRVSLGAEVDPWVRLGGRYLWKTEQPAGYFHPVAANEWPNNIQPSHRFWIKSSRYHR